LVSNFPVVETLTSGWKILLGHGCNLITFQPFQELLGRHAVVVAVGNMLCHITPVEIHFVIPIVVRVVLDDPVTGNARIAAVNRPFLSHGPTVHLGLCRN